MKSTIRFIDAKTGKRISARAASSILYQAIKAGDRIKPKGERKRAGIAV